MKKTKLYLFVLAVLFIGTFSFGGCTRADAIQRIETYSGFDLPDGIVELYTYYDSVFVGLAGQYSVFSYETPIEIFADSENEPAAWKTCLVEDRRQNIMEFLQNWNTLEEFRPDFTQEYRYLYGAENTYIFDFYIEKELKIFMFGH